jgi:hypothetical protein
MAKLRSDVSFMNQMFFFKSFLICCMNQYKFLLTSPNMKLNSILSTKENVLVKLFYV